jgi:hypothetical protein
MADEVVSAEQTMEQELEALLNPKTPAPAGEPGDGATPKPGEQKPVVASPPASEKPEGELTETEKILKALDEPEDGEQKPKEGEKPEEKDKGPQLSEEQQKVLNVIPNAEAAMALVNVATNYNMFTGALETGRFEEVHGMIQAWNPAVMEGWLEYVYTQKVATGEWVDRFCEENDPEVGKNPAMKEVRAVRGELNKLQKQLAEKQTNNAQEEQTARVQKAFTAYNDHVHGLFEKYNFNKADRPWVVDALNARVAGNKEVLTKIQSGDVTAVNKLFKEVCKSYLTRDKQVVEQTQEQVQQQEKKKIPLGGGSGTEVAPLSDDVRQVPKEQEENWLKQQLGRLFSK